MFQTELFNTCVSKAYFKLLCQHSPTTYMKKAVNKDRNYLANIQTVYTVYTS